MERRPSLLQKIRDLLRRKPRPQTPRARRRPERRVISGLEPLEGRISPATLVNATTVMFKDLDGDIVTVRFSKSLFTQSTSAANLALANNILKFQSGTIDKTGAFNAASETTNQQLQLIDLTKASIVGGRNSALGTTITVTAVKVGSGNGVADVGYINATDLTLGAVSISGDLGQIDAGVNSSPLALASLKVKSLGVSDPNVTQATAGRSVISNLKGQVGPITVLGDVNTASILVANAGSTPGKIASLVIGGSLKGGTAADSGLISATLDIGSVKIGTLATDGIIGGSGNNSGRINADGKIGSVTISGDLQGAAGVGSGTIRARSSIGPISIRGDVEGGAGRDSGSITASGLGSVTIGGSLKAGTDDGGSGIISSLRDIGLVRITGDIDGSITGTGDSVGVGGIRAEGRIAGLTVLGSIKGGAQANSGFVDAGGDIGAIVVRSLVGGGGLSSGSISAGGRIASVSVTTDVTGGGGASSGSIFSGVDSALAGDMGAVRVGGKLLGAGGDNSGSIVSGARIGAVTIGPAVPTTVSQVLGGGGAFSGTVTSFGPILSVKVNGNVEGGSGASSGSIISRDFITESTERAGDIGAIVITGDLIGGTNTDAGAIRAEGRLSTVMVGDLVGDSGNRSASIRAGLGSINTGTGLITVKGSMTGAGGTQSASIVAMGRIAGVTVLGDIDAASVRAGNDLAALTVTGSIENGAVISARGIAVQGATDLAIGRITVGGNVSDAQILAGYDISLAASNPDAQVGAVSVRGNWVRSDLVAGAADGGDGEFGNANDVKIGGTDNAKIISSIASVVIGGNLQGSAGGDRFGFVAQRLGNIVIGGQVNAFTVAAGEVRELLPGATNDVTAREIAI